MVKTMTIDEAAKYLRENGVKISKETLSDGIQAEKLPFGVCIETGRSRVLLPSPCGVRVVSAIVYNISVEWSTAFV